MVHTRLSEGGRAWVVTVGDATHSSAAEVIRAALAVAARHEAEVKDALTEGRRF